jgi:hypothetical protein
MRRCQWCGVMLCVVAISYTQGREHRLVVNRKEERDRDREREREG